MQESSASFGEGQRSLTSFDEARWRVVGLQRHLMTVFERKTRMMEAWGEKREEKEDGAV